MSNRVTRSRTISSVIAAACLAAVCTLALAIDSASAAREVCGTLGLTPSTVRHAESILREVADESGAPVCKVSTSEGTAYASIYRPSDARALHISWEFGIPAHQEALPGPGADATCFFTPDFRLEAIGFDVGKRYVWLTTAGRYMHPEMLSLAAAIGTHLAASQ